MAELKIEKHKWQPDFKNETWITDKRRQEQFQITLKQGEDIVHLLRVNDLNIFICILPHSAGLLVKKRGFGDLFRGGIAA